MSSNNQIKSFVERIERLEEERKATAEDIRGIYAEAKGAGFDVKALRHIIRLRKQDAQERQHHEALVAAYMDALGDFVSTPLGKAGMPEARAATGN